jgi:hypothetical protein
MRLSDQLHETIERQRGIVARRQLLDDGVTPAEIRWATGRRCQPVLPRVLAMFTGALDEGQRLIAGQLWAGPDSHIAGLTAARWHGLPDVPADGVVRLLVPWRCEARRQSFAVRWRTRRMDPHPWSRGVLTVCSPARSLVDAAREVRDRNTIQSMLIAATQQRRVREADLRAEVEAGAIRGSALVRSVLNDVSTGAWSRPELEVLEELARSTVLPRVWPNPQLITRDGQPLPTPDFWIHEAGIAGQIHSRQYHARDQDWERTVSADRVFAEHGIIVLAVTPTGFRRDPAAFRERVERAYLAAVAAGGRPDVRMTARAVGILQPASHTRPRTQPVTR